MKKEPNMSAVKKQSIDVREPGYKEVKKGSRKSPANKAKKPAKKVAPVETEIGSDTKVAFEERTWYEFQQSGFLLFVNLFLQVFGWSIVMTVDDNGLVRNVYPARTRWRGFGPEELSKAYVRVSEFMFKNAKKLLAEAKDY